MEYALIKVTTDGKKSIVIFSTLQEAKEEYNRLSKSCYLSKVELRTFTDTKGVGALICSSIG